MIPPVASICNFQQHSTDLCPTDVTMVMTYWSDCHAIPSKILFVCDWHGLWTFCFTSNFTMTTDLHQLSISNNIASTCVRLMSPWSWHIDLIVMPFLVGSYLYAISMVIGLFDLLLIFQWPPTFINFQFLIAYHWIPFWVFEHYEVILL